MICNFWSQFYQVLVTYGHKSITWSYILQIQRRVKFSEAEAAKIVRDLASALEFLHCRGIAHRDLKVSRVYLKCSQISYSKFGTI